MHAVYTYNYLAFKIYNSKLFNDWIVGCFFPHTGWIKLQLINPCWFKNNLFLQQHAKIFSFVWQLYWELHTNNDRYQRRQINSTKAIVCSNSI